MTKHAKAPVTYMLDGVNCRRLMDQNEVIINKIREIYLLICI